MNRLGSIQDGKPVYNMFVADTHVSREIPVADGVLLDLTLDLHLLLFLVKRFVVVGLSYKNVAFDMGIVLGCRTLRSEIATRYGSLK